MRQSMTTEKAHYNVLIITVTLGVGGLETYVLNLIKTLDRNRFTPYIVYEGRGDQTYRSEIEKMGIEVLRIPCSRIQAGFLLSICSVMRSRNIDIVCDFRSDFAGPTLFAAKLLGVKSRVDMYRSSKAGFKPTLLRNMFAGLLRQITKHSATCIIGNTGKVLDSFYRNWQSDGRFAVINNGLAIERFSGPSAKNVIRAAFKISAKKIVIGHLGRLHESKNHDTILEVFKRLHARCAETHLLIVGKGPLKQHIEDQVNRMGLHNCVTLAGERRDIPEVLSAMDIFFFPSIYEGMPNALLEAMCCGLPFVGSNIHEIVEIVPPQLRDQLCRPCDKETLETRLFELCENPGKREHIGTVARQWVCANYSIEKSVDQLCNRWLMPFKIAKTGMLR